MLKVLFSYVCTTTHDVKNCDPAASLDLHFRLHRCTCIVCYSIEEVAWGGSF